MSVLQHNVRTGRTAGPGAMRVPAGSRLAVRVIGGEDLERLLAAFEAVGDAAFICNGQGELLALSSAAEALVKSQAHLSRKGLRLRADHPADDDQMKAMIRDLATGSAAGGALGEILIRPRQEGAPLILELARVQSCGSSGASVLIRARAPRPLSGWAPLLQKAYDLTPAEIEVAIGVAGGKEIQHMARDRSVSVETLRSHLKRATGKLGVRRQAELAALLNSL